MAVSQRVRKLQAALEKTRQPHQNVRARRVGMEVEAMACATSERLLSPNAPYDICECGCSRVEHFGVMGHLHCSAHKSCKRFTWSHFSKPPVRA